MSDSRRSRSFLALFALTLVPRLAVAQQITSVIDIPGRPAPENVALPQEVTIDEANNRIYVSNGAYAPAGVGDAILIDGATDSFVGTIPTGAYPWGIAFNRVTGKLYVASQAYSGITVIDTATLTPVGTIAAGAQFNGVAVDPVANRIYATRESSSQLWILDGTNDSVISVEDVGVFRPALMAIDVPRHRIYISNNSAAPVQVFDTQANAVVNSLPVAFGRPAIDAVNDRLYFHDVYGQTLHVYDRLTETLITTLPISPAPLASDPLIGLAYSAASNRIYLSRGLSTTVLVLDAATLQTVAVLSGGNYGIGINTATNKVYVAERSSTVDGDVPRPGRVLVIADIVNVGIDIKPGSSPNAINLGSNGVVPVAVLSTPSFDATTVDPATVTLAGAHVRLRGKGAPSASFRDVNGDGLIDLVVQVETEVLQLSGGDTQAVLRGTTFTGTAISGTDSVRIVP